MPTRAPSPWHGRHEWQVLARLGVDGVKWQSLDSHMIPSLVTDQAIWVIQPPMAWEDVEGRTLRVSHETCNTPQRYLIRSDGLLIDCCCVTFGAQARKLGGLGFHWLPWEGGRVEGRGSSHLSTG